jgi:hypothetical protein
MDIAASVDIAGVGNGCAFEFPGTFSCIAGGRIDASENDDVGCDFDTPSRASFAGSIDIRYHRCTRGVRIWSFFLQKAKIDGRSKAAEVHLVPR